MSPTKAIANIYNPANLTAEELIEGFVVRCATFRRLFESIRNAPMTDPEQHYIVQGPRGTGKTTLLLRLKYAVQDDDQLRGRLIPIAFKEEQYGIRSLFRLWDAVADYLEEEAPDEFKGLYDQVAAIEDDADQCFELLIRALHKRNKKLLLLIDNIGELFGKLSKKETQRLREILLTTTDLIIIGASAVILEHTYDYTKPFFDFFKFIHLQGIDRQETETLLLHLGEKYGRPEIQEIVKHQKGRIESLRRLTGGIPRSIILLFEIFADDKNGDSFKDLELILDRVTPLYKHRMDDLSPQQQDIVNTIAMHWDAVSTKEIAASVHMPSKAISAQLRELEKNRIVNKIRTTTKNHLYQITERFFNIWYLMRHGRKKDKNRVLWLVRFLEAWCSEKDLVKRAQTLKQALQKGNYNPQHAYFLTEALIRTSLPMKDQHDLIKETRKFLQISDKLLFRDLSRSDAELCKEAIDLIENHKLSEALNNLLEVKNKEPWILELLGATFENLNETEQAKKYYIMAADKDHISAMFNLAELYRKKLKDYRKAERYYIMAARKDHAKAVLSLAILYHTELNNYELAEKYYLMAVDKDHSSAMHNLASLYANEFKDYKQAEKYYLMAADKNDTSAMNNLGLLYHHRSKDYKRAEKYYRMAIDNNDANAMNNLAGLYATKLKDFKKAEEYCRMAVDKDHVGAMRNLALLYEMHLKDFKRAEEYYLMAVGKNDTIAMNNLADLYRIEFKDFKRAQKYFLMAANKGDAQGMNSLAWMYFKNRTNRQECLKFAQQAMDTKANFENQHTLSCALLWNDRIEEAMKQFDNTLQHKDKLDEYLDDMQLSLIFFISKKQYHYVLNLFEDKLLKLKDRFKPIYYALMTLMQGEYPNEVKKMGPELQETVDEVLLEIEKMAKDYDYMETFA